MCHGQNMAYGLWSPISCWESQHNGYLNPYENGLMTNPSHGTKGGFLKYGYPRPLVFPLIVANFG